jgi:hypothetical protein
LIVGFGQWRPKRGPEVAVVLDVDFDVEEGKQAGLLCEAERI